MAELGPIVAKINGETIFAADLELYLATIHQSAASMSRADFDINRLMFRVINDVLLAQESRALGLGEIPLVRQEVEDFRQRESLLQLEREEIGNKAEPSDAQIHEAFERDLETTTLRVLTVDQKSEASDLLDQLRAGGDFSKLAEEHSRDPYRMRGGLVESVPRVDLQREVADLAFDLEAGDLAGPIETDLGWTVLRVVSFKDPDPADYEKELPELRNIVWQRKVEAIRSDLAKDFRSRHAVRVDQVLIDSIQPRKLPDGRVMPTIESRSQVIAEVGDHVSLTSGEYAQALVRRWGSVRTESAASRLAPLVLEKLIQSKLFLAEAISRGYADTELARHHAYTFETQLLVPRYLDEVLGADIQIPEEQKRTYYDEHKETLRRPPRLRISQITVATRPEADELRGLLEGGADFGWLAKSRSIDRFKNLGGDAGWEEVNSRGDEYQRMLLQADVGEVFGPFGDEGNFVLIKVVAKDDQGVYSYDEVSATVEQMLASQEFDRRLDSTIKKLRERSEIEVHEDLIVDLVFGGTKTTSQKGGAGVD